MSSYLLYAELKLSYPRIIHPSCRILMPIVLLLLHVVDFTRWTQLALYPPSCRILMPIFLLLLHVVDFTRWTQPAYHPSCRILMPIVLLLLPVVDFTRWTQLALYPTSCRILMPIVLLLLPVVDFTRWTQPALYPSSCRNSLANCPSSIACCQIHTLNTTCPLSNFSCLFFNSSIPSSCRNSLDSCPSSIAGCCFHTLNTTCPYSYQLSQCFCQLSFFFLTCFSIPEDLRDFGACQHSPSGIIKIYPF